MEQELFSAVHSVGMGGIGFGLAKMAMAGEMGAEIDLGMIPTEEGLKIQELLFSETQSRLIVSISPEKNRRFEDIFGYEDFALIGKVIPEPELVFTSAGSEFTRIGIRELKENYLKTLGW